MAGQESEIFRKGVFFGRSLDKISSFGQELINEMVKYDLQERKNHAYTKTLACLARKNFHSVSELFKECMEITGEENEYVLGRLKPVCKRFVQDYKRCMRYIKRQATPVA